MTQVDRPEITVDARVLYCYDRASIEHGTEAPSIRNQALALFQAAPRATRVLLLRKPLTTCIFFIVEEVAGVWFDVAGHPVLIQNLGEESS